MRVSRNLIFTYSCMSVGNPWSIIRCTCMSHLHPRHHTVTSPPFFALFSSRIFYSSGAPVLLRSERDRPHRLYNLQRVGKGERERERRRERERQKERVMKDSELEEFVQFWVPSPSPPPKRRSCVARIRRDSSWPLVFDAICNRDLWFATDSFKFWQGKYTKEN